MRKSILMALLFISAGMSGCRRGSGGGSSGGSGEIIPSGQSSQVAGTWTGTLSPAAKPTTAFSMSLIQSGITLTGTYQCTTPALMASSGTIYGTVSDLSMSLEFHPLSPTCPNGIDVFGQYVGSAFSFDIFGADCSNSAVSGKGAAQKAG